jgi:hypothetical protein
VKNVQHAQHALCFGLSAALAAALLTSHGAAQELAIPPASGGNFHLCFNEDGDGYSCCEENLQSQQRSGSWITGDSDGIDDVAVTDDHSVLISSGAFRKHVIDYRAYFNDGDPICGPEPIVETPHHTPFVLEFSRYFRSRSSYVDYGMSKGWKENYFFLLSISSSAGYRNARLEVPSGSDMNWIDVGSTGNWTDDSIGHQQSMVMALTDEPGDQHLVTDRWGGKYHFVPNTTTRPFLQYLIDWLEDENGNRITLTYNSAGYPLLAADAYGRTISYAWTFSTFNGTRHLAHVVLPNGRTLFFQHNFNNPLVYTLTYPNGEVASNGFGSDADGTYYYSTSRWTSPGSGKRASTPLRRTVVPVRHGTRARDQGRDRARPAGARRDALRPAHRDRLRRRPRLPVRLRLPGPERAGHEPAHRGDHHQRGGRQNGGVLKKKIDALGSWLTADYDDNLSLRVLRHNPTRPPTPGPTGDEPRGRPRGSERQPGALRLRRERQPDPQDLRGHELRGMDAPLLRSRPTYRDRDGE